VSKASNNERRIAPQVTVVLAQEHSDGWQYVRVAENHELLGNLELLPEDFVGFKLLNQSSGRPILFIARVSECRQTQIGQYKQTRN
jgi:hypothetical protein